jgi:hypothetical protein
MYNYSSNVWLVQVGDWSCGTKHCPKFLVQWHTWQNTCQQQRSRVNLTVWIVWSSGRMSRNRFPSPHALINGEKATRCSFVVFGGKKMSMGSKSGSICIPRRSPPLLSLWNCGSLRILLGVRWMQTGCSRWPPVAVRAGHQRPSWQIHGWGLPIFSLRCWCWRSWIAFLPEGSCSCEGGAGPKGVPGNWHWQHSTGVAANLQKEEVDRSANGQLVNEIKLLLMN